MMSLSLPIPQIRLGNDGPLVGTQGLGCMGMSEFYGATDMGDARATLERALDCGVTLFDTADMYGLGANERFLAPFVRAHRDRLLIATKFGYARSLERPDDWSLDNRPAFIRRAVEASLTRLNAETIDLYYMHRRDPTIPLEDSVGEMARLVQEGKVRWLGLCVVSASDLEKAHGIHPIAALQSEWSVFTRDIESDVVGTAARLGVTIVPYSPLGRGILTGRSFGSTLEADDARRNFPRFSADNQAINANLVDQIEGLAETLDVTPAQLALAWLYTKAAELGVGIVPIPGTRRIARLEENLAATALHPTQLDMDALDTLAASVQGIAI